MKRLLIGGLALVAFAAFGATASAQDKVKGEKVFAERGCPMCHSIAGKGNVKGLLDDVGSKLTADEIRQWITDPAGSAAKAKAERKPAMSVMQPKFKDLSKEDLDSLVAYLASLKKK
jgi:mono/diheme cytochrome c family protein